MSGDPSQDVRSHLEISLPPEIDEKLSLPHILFSLHGLASVHVKSPKPPAGMSTARIASFVEQEALAWAQDAKFETGWGVGVAFWPLPTGMRAAGAFLAPDRVSLTSDDFPSGTSLTRIVVTLIERLWNRSPPGNWTVETAMEPAFDLSPMWVSPPGETALRLAPTAESRAILSGSFFPLHDGHRKFAAAAAEFLGQPVCYELPAMNADKPNLDLIMLNRRAAQFRDDLLYVTNAPHFSNKAALFPGSTFLIGWDTAVRVLDRRYSLDGKLESMLDPIAGAGCRFLVAARSHHGAMQTLRDLNVPTRYHDLFLELPPDRFFEEISSTEIRDRWWRGEIECPGL